MATSRCSPNLVRVLPGFEHIIVEVLHGLDLSVEICRVYRFPCATYRSGNLFAGDIM